MLKSTQNILRITSKLISIPQIDQARNIKRWVAPTLRELQRRREKVGPPKEEPRSSYLEWNYEAELFAFGKRLGENFKNDLLKRALTQRQYALDKGDGENVKIEDNLEMVNNGRRIIDDYLTKEFNKNYPDVIVGVLKDYLMNERVLVKVGMGIGLKDIILSKEFPIDDKTISDAFCAIISALNTSSGLEVTEKFIKDFLMVQLTGKELFDLWDLDNPYDYLKNVIKDEIEPRLCNQSGVNTILANFQVGLYSKKKLLGIGFGESIDIAKNTAALDVLNKMYMKRHVFV